MSVKFLTKAPTFGFESENIRFGKEYKHRNRAKYLGYIPFVSTIFYITKRKSFTSTNSTTHNVNRDRFRYAVGICSLGFVFAVPDLIVTVKRKCQQLNQKSKGSKQEQEFHQNVKRAQADLSKGTQPINREVSSGVKQFNKFVSKTSKEINTEINNKR